MIKKYKVTMIITSFITILPVFAGMLLWNKLPDRVATHFNITNMPDGWSSKAFAVFGIPLFLLAIHWVGLLATSLDPKTKNISSKAINLVLWICPVISVLVNSLTYAYSLGKNPRIGFFVLLFLGIMFMVIGNYMPKCKQNYSFGIKIPWTLNDEVNWNKTHRFAGKIYVIGGALLTVTAIFENPVISGVFLAMMLILPFIYSYRIYKSRKTA